MFFFRDFIVCFITETIYIVFFHYSFSSSISYLLEKFNGNNDDNDSDDDTNENFDDRNNNNDQIIIY